MDRFGAPPDLPHQCHFNQPLANSPDRWSHCWSNTHQTSVWCTNCSRFENLLSSKLFWGMVQWHIGLVQCMVHWHTGLVRCMVHMHTGLVYCAKPSASESTLSGKLVRCTHNTSPVRQLSRMPGSFS